jgi:hypothetical protein
LTNSKNGCYTATLLNFETTMRKMPASAAAELAVQGSERLAAGLDDCEARIELADWLGEHLQQEDVLRAAKLIARDAGVEALAYYNRALRLVAGTVEVTTEGVREYIVLVAMPLFFSGDPRPDGARTTEWGQRQIIERYLESTLGLRMLSVRLAAFPVEAVPLSQLTALQQQKLIMDLHKYGDSRLVAQPALHFDGDENGLIWPGIIRFRVDSYVEEFSRFREGITSPKIARFRTFAARELTRCLNALALNPQVTVYPAVQLADSFSSYRLLKLSRIARRVLQEKPDIRSIIYRFKGGRLTLWFLSDESTFEEVAEVDFSEDKPQPVYDALRYLQKKTGLHLQEVNELPAIPGQAAGTSR